MVAAIDRAPEKLTNLHETDPSPPGIQVRPAYKNLTCKNQKSSYLSSEDILSKALPL